MISDYLNAINQFHTDTKQDLNGRNRSWIHCYTVFSQARSEKNLDYDYLSLQLHQYLASWGMLRGSSFLLWKDYKVHIPVIQEMMKSEYDCLQGITCQDFLNDNALSAWQKLDKFQTEYYGTVRQDVEERTKRKNAKNTLSRILRSKILLGILGCTPAYDRFFVKMVKTYGISGNYGKNSFKQLARFYQENYSEFEKYRQILKIEGSDVVYPQMKLLDMGFWQLGFNEEQRINKNKMKNS